MKIVVDSYAWIELFLGSAKGQKVREFIEEASLLYTPDTVLGEIARKYMREGVAEDVIKQRLEQVSSNSKVIPINSDLALEAAKSYLELVENARKRKLSSPSLFDAIVLATARTLGAKVLTGDEHFKSLPETLWV